MNQMAGIESGSRSVGEAFGEDALRCLAVTRGTQHAAKHVSNDALMFELVCNGLREYGWRVECVPENDLAGALKRTPLPDCIISMAQHPENVALLEEAERTGLLVVNASAAVTNCYRTTLVEVLADSEVPFGHSVRIETDGGPDFAEVTQEVGTTFWLKRGDIHAAHRNDVRCIESEEEYRAALADFRRRGIPSIVAQEHLRGDVVKFYAVRETGFFHAQYFETEEDVPFDTAPLEKIADAAALRVGLTIYGGDVVMTSAGPILIDLNPWPSFGRVREQAAPKMVEAIGRTMQNSKGKIQNVG